MNNVIEQMLQKYEIKNTKDEINALKEIIQEIVLSGLSRGGFFDNESNITSTFVKKEEICMIMFSFSKRNKCYYRIS